MPWSGAFIYINQPRRTVICSVLAVRAEFYPYDVPCAEAVALAILFDVRDTHGRSRLRVYGLKY
jgi:hypothetical protein